MKNFQWWATFTYSGDRLDLRNFIVHTISSTGDEGGLINEIEDTTGEWAGYEEGRRGETVALEVQDAAGCWRIEVLRLDEGEAGV